MIAKIVHATPDVVTWRAGDSLTIESHRSAVETWMGEVDFMGHVFVDGLALLRGDLRNMLDAMDDAEAREQADTVQLDRVHDHLTGGL